MQQPEPIYSKSKSIAAENENAGTQNLQHPSITIENEETEEINAQIGAYSYGEEEKRGRRQRSAQAPTSEDNGSDLPNNLLFVAENGQSGEEGWMGGEFI